MLLSSFPLRRADLILTEVDGHLSERFLCLSWWQCGKVLMLGRSISCVDMTSYSLTFIHMITYMKQMRVPFSLVCKNPGGGGTLGISGWGCAAGTLEPLTYTRASSAEFCYPILE